jgi:hypothetical protein
LTTFAYQPYYPEGIPNTPVLIPAGGTQTYVFAFAPTGAFPPTDIQLSFACANTASAQIVSGLNTFQLSASALAVPNIMALAAPLSGDGIVNIGGSSEGPPMVGVFSVATVNLGAAGTITVSADTGSSFPAAAATPSGSLPVNILLCQTIPATGQCLSAPGTTVTTQINANATPTFGIFVTATGTIPFDPANNRIFVRFRDAAGVTRGATSVAVRTQ